MYALCHSAAVDRAYIKRAHGHTAGSSILVVRWKGEDLYFAGDLVSTQGKPRVQSTYAQDWAHLKKELKALIETDEGPEYMFPGHGSDYLDPEELKALKIPDMYGRDDDETDPLEPSEAL